MLEKAVGVANSAMLAVAGGGSSRRRRRRRHRHLGNFSVIRGHSRQHPPRNFSIVGCSNIREGSQHHSRGVLLVILVLLAVMLLEKAVGVAISVILAVAGGGSPHRRWRRNFSIVGLQQSRLVLAILVLSEQAVSSRQSTVCVANYRVAEEAVGRKLSCV